jgi:hypothetical protein
MKYVYGVLMVLGLCLPWWFNVEFIRAHGGFSTVTFIAEAFTTPASRSICVDIIIASTAWMAWMVAEARRLGMRHWWIYIALTFGVAFAFACPLFLFMRERRLVSSRS